MFRLIFDHPQGDIFFFNSVTKEKINWFVVACMLYLCFVLYSTVQYSNNQTRKSINKKHKYNRHATTNQIILSLVTEVKRKYLPEDGQKLTETCWRILRLLRQYDHFNVF